MANMEYHEIYLEGIKEKLLEKGVVVEKVLSEAATRQTSLAGASLNGT